MKILGEVTLPSWWSLGLLAWSLGIAIVFSCLSLSLWKWCKGKNWFLISLNSEGYFQSNGDLFYLGSHSSPRSWIVHWNGWCSNIKPSWDPTQCQSTLQDWNPEAWGQATFNVPKNYWAKKNNASFCPFLPLGHLQQKPDFGTSSVLGMTRLPHPALSSGGSQSSTHVHGIFSGSDWACRLLRESLVSLHFVPSTLSEKNRKNWPQDRLKVVEL